MTDAAGAPPLARLEHLPLAEYVKGNAPPLQRR
jgi:hypothetical protein